MSAGQLRNRVSLQSQVSTQDDLGQPSTSWLTIATLWADVRFLSGVESIKSGTDASLARASIRIRRRAVDAGQRIVFGDTVFEIKSVLPDQKRVFVDLVCEAINAKTS